MIKNIVLLCLLLLFTTCINAQCEDLIENYSLHKPEFRTIGQTISTPILSPDSSSFYNANSYLIKHNKEDNVEWTKNIPNFRTSFSTESNEIIGVFSSDTLSTTAPIGGGIAKLSANGELLWAKKINISGNIFGHWGSERVTEGKNGDIFLFNYHYGEIGLAIFNEDLTQTKLTRHFNLQLLPAQYLVGMNVVLSSNSIFMLCYLSESSFYFEKNDLLLIKLNYQTGAIEKTRHIHLNDELFVPVSPYISYRFEGVFSPNLTLKSLGEKHLIIAGRKGINALDNNRLFAMKVDTGLNVEKYVIYTAKGHRYFNYNYSTVLPSINKNGSILFSNIRDYSIYNNYRDSSFMLVTDNQLNIVSQRKLSIADNVQLSGNYQINSVPLLKDNGDISLIFHTVSADAGLINIVNIPAGLTDLPCRGEDANYITIEMPDFTELTSPVITELPPLVVNITPYHDLKVFDDSVEVNKFCIQQSICDTIRIFKSSNDCMVGDTATFGLIKNRQCHRETIWQIDTSAFKVLLANGTLLSLQYLKPFAGYIRARFKNCELADSFFIAVKDRLQPFSIGRDTMICPGKIYTIQATAGYENYLWSNGEKIDSLIVSTPGIYYVSAEDYCGVKSYDTITISGLPRQFSISYSGKICSFDTATISIDPLFKNYNWEPGDKALLSHGTQLLLFPITTTDYIITAEAFPGCIVRDSVKVVVDNCPSEIIFPNAFSPNNDGLNDEFKPVVSRKLKLYRLLIYNRYGQNIFQSTNPANGWNGSYRNELVNQGIYTWVCEYSFPNSTQKYIKGTVALIR